ncbi:MAG: Crp/Fnr family transcriptional regulator, partial [Nevskiales bacterium]
MALATPEPMVNRLLGALPPRARQRILQRCEPVELAYGTVLCDSGEHIRHIYFPTGCFISLVAVLKNKASLEVGLIGDEG